MKIVSKPHKLGRLLLAVLALASSSCRNSLPPPKEICILNGSGLGLCVEADGTKKTRVPSEMNNYWATNQTDMAAFSSWCYDANGALIDKMMLEIQTKATSQ